MAINFFSEGIKSPKIDRIRLKRWIKQVVNNEGCIVGDISIVFVNDEYLLKINREYLQHDYFTDIITFDYSQTLSNKRTIAGDLFISVDTTLKNSIDYNVQFDFELNRVIIHGILHLIGYKDKTTLEFESMKAKEDVCLQLLETIS